MARRAIKRTTAAKIPVVPKNYSASELKALTKNQIISELTKSPHGELTHYAQIGLFASKEDPNFFARLIAWNHVKGSVRDAKVALPVIALVGNGDAEFTDNALAHIADLRPKQLLKALEFSRVVGAPRNLLKRLTGRYLADLEADAGAWERTAVVHRQSLKALYTRFHIKPSGKAQQELFDGQGGGRLAAIRKLKELDPVQIASVVVSYKLPFLQVRGALKERAKEPDVLVALIKRMTAAELVTNMKALERLGVKDVPAARAALDEAMTAAASNRKAASLKASVAADAVDDEMLSQKLNKLQEKQLDIVQGIEGNWLVAGDRSPSMAGAIELTKEIAAVLARLVRGKVACVFFDEMPTYFDVSGKTLDEIKKMTRHIAEGSSTSIGCALQYCVETGIPVDGMAIISDGEENSSPYFVDAYAAYEKKFGNAPTVYFYWMKGTGEPLRSNARLRGIDLQVFDLRSKTDYFALPNLVETMRVGRYSLYDEVMRVELRTLDEVLTRTKGQNIVCPRQVLALT